MALTVHLTSPSIRYIGTDQQKRHSPQPETYWFVFDGGTGYTQVELAILLDAGIDQSLNRGLFLEEQEGVACEE